MVRPCATQQHSETRCKHHQCCVPPNAPNLTHTHPKENSFEVEQSTLLALNMKLLMPKVRSCDSTPRARSVSEIWCPHFLPTAKASRLINSQIIRKQSTNIACATLGKVLLMENCRQSTPRPKKYKKNVVLSVKSYLPDIRLISGCFNAVQPYNASTNPAWRCTANCAWGPAFPNTETPKAPTAWPPGEAVAAASRGERFRPPAKANVSEAPWAARRCHPSSAGDTWMAEVDEKWIEMVRNV